MADNDVHPILRDIEERYRQKTPKSAEHNARARHRLPGGDTRTATYYQPYPANMVRGKGCRLYDADGNEYIDLVNGFGQTAFGHSPDFVINAITRQMERGFAIGPQSDLAGPVAERFVG